MSDEDAGPRIALPSWDGEGNSSGTRTGSVANRKLFMTEQFCGVGIVNAVPTPIFFLDGFGHHIVRQHQGFTPNIGGHGVTATTL
jgi:hypothetical protein